MKRGLISIVVPVFHNAASLSDLLSELQALAERTPQHDFSFVFVDDGSTDNSFAVLEELFRTEPRMRIFRLSRNFGSNSAIRAGLDNSDGDATVVISADLQDSPRVVDKMIQEWESGARVVLAARTQRDDPFFSRVFADLFYRLFRAYGIANMPANGFDVFLVNAKVRGILSQMEERNLYLMGLTLWVGFNPSIVYYRREKRKTKYGRSMWTFSKKVKYFIDGFVAFSYAPIRAASLMGMGIGTLGGLYALFVIYIRFTRPFAASGWASIMVTMLVLSGLQMFMLGIFGEYLWRNLDESRRRPKYIVDQAMDHIQLRPSQALPERRLINENIDH